MAHSSTPSSTSLSTLHQASKAPQTRCGEGGVLGRHGVAPQHPAPATATRSGALGKYANNSSAVTRHDREALRTAKFELRRWAQKSALFVAEDPREAHRVSLCGWATTTSDSGVGVRVSGGVAGFSGLQSCGSVWACPVCAAKISSRRAEELGSVLGWARTEGHTLAMVTLTVSHKRKDSLKDVWDSVGSGWSAVTSGSSWKSETEAAFEGRLGRWQRSGEAYEHGKFVKVIDPGTVVPRAPRGWHKSDKPARRIGDQERFGILGWARAVEVTRGAHGWHTHIHAVIVLDGNQDPHRRSYALGDAMRTRWNAGIGKKGFKSSELHGLKVDVSEGAEKRLAEYLTKSSEPEKAVRQAVEIAGRNLAREATLGQHKEAKKGGRTPFQILSDLRIGDAEDWALWAEWLRDSKGRKQLTWSSNLREIAGLVEEESDEVIAGEEIGTEADTILVLPIDTWRVVRSDSAAMAKILILAESSPAELLQWLDQEGLHWLTFSKNSTKA